MAGQAYLDQSGHSIESNAFIVTSRGLTLFLLLRGELESLLPLAIYTHESVIPNEHMMKVHSNAGE